MTAVVGEIGGRLDIQVKVGTTVGPFLLKFQQPDGTYASFTGTTLTAKARTRSTPAVNVAMTAILADPASFSEADWVMGQAILLSVDKVESAKFEAPATMGTTPKVSDWNLEVLATDGTLTPLLWGEIKSYLRLP